MCRTPLISCLFLVFSAVPALAREPESAALEDVSDVGESESSRPAAVEDPETESSTETMKVQLDESPPETNTPVEQRTEPVSAESTQRPPEQVAPVVTSQAPSSFSKMDERMLLREQIDSLEEERDERYSLGGPISIMAIGGGLTIGGLLFLAQGIALRSTASIGGSATSGVADTGSALMGVGALGLVTGGGFLIGGGVWLSKRLDRRRPYNEEIEGLESQIDFYGSVRVRPLVGNDRLGLGVTGVF